MENLINFCVISSMYISSEFDCPVGASAIVVNVFSMTEITVTVLQLTALKLASDCYITNCWAYKHNFIMLCASLLKI